ncbi:porin family protein [Mucilaginibacter myungsuensis]|uniref:PorT family protein n=1 Tax=Mucilaginibacter myungsuensis TaxID=649104 RepID=A0A929KUB7_9SPHI|nr:porin family protein [Mucilaginibacter myungsuensis]MBE9660580.1 PorT family protein [Mucilaginibacter myungsuensis]MDN3600624.1 porin family protein [Mucilaginibacter myungsuensis]
MKRLLITLVAVLAAGTAAFSQTKGQTEFGVGVGLNLATVVVDETNQNAGTRAGLNVGLSADHYFSDSWSLKVKALFDQKGWSKGYLTIGTSTTYTPYQLNYITVPVMANWHFGRTKGWYLNFGPYVSVLVSAKTTANNFDVKPFFNDVDAGLALGIGYKFPVADKTKFFVEFAGQGGIADISTANNAVYRNSLSAFNIGLNF